MSLGGSLTSFEEVLARVTSVCGDEETTERSEGWYIGAVRDALKELAIDTKFDERVFTAAIPASLTVLLPRDQVDIINVYLYDGVVCNTATAPNVYTHINFVRHNQGEFSENKGYNTPDPIIENSMPWADEMDLFYYGIQGNRLMLSNSCGRYGNVYVEYAGLGSTPGKRPCVPTELKDAVIDWVAVEALRIRTSRPIAVTQDEAWGRWMQLLGRAEERKSGKVNPPYDGSWHKARKRVQEIDQKLRRDVAKYLTDDGALNR